MQARRTLAITSLIVLMIVWGSTFVVTKAAAQEISPLVLATLRFLIGSLALIPIALARGGIGRLPRPVPWVPFILMAATGIAGFAVTFTYGLVYGSAAQGALIYAALPAAIAVAAVLFLKERPSKRRVAGIVLSVVGVALLIVAGEADSGSPDPVLGALWMLGAIAAWTAYTVLGKRLAHADHIVSITVISVIGTVMLLPAAGMELAQTPWTNPSLGSWLAVLFLGIVASALAYIAYNYALSELDASLVGVYTNLDPIVGVLIAVLFFGEILHSGQIVGGLIAFAGMWLASLDG